MFLIKRSLFAKILLSMLVATTIPLFFSNYVSYHIIGRSVKGQLVELNQNAMGITMSSIHKYVHDISMLALSYYSDPEVMRVLTKEEVQTPAETVYANKRMERIYAGYQEIRSVEFKSALTNKSFQIKPDLHDRMTIPHFEDRRLINEGEEFKRDYAVTTVNGERRLRINKYLIDFSTQEYIGLTSMTVKDSTLQLLAEPLSTSDESTVYLLLQDDLQLLYATSSEPAELDWVARLHEATFELDGVTNGILNDPHGIYIYHRDVSHNLPLTLVKFIPKSVIDQAGKKALNESLMLQIAAILLVSVMAGVISYFILSRVKRILQHIKHIQMGNFKIKTGSTGTDELGVLEERFQDMIKELDVLWNQQYRYQLEVSNARLKMLQAQINPHFLYNTLQSIGTLAIKKNAREVSDRLAELGAMFRYNMDIDTEVVRVQDELDHLSHYISLQMGRFQQKLQYTENCAEEALGMLVPKMILQPLVENSIVHGIERGSGAGAVHVQIELAEQLVIRVTDNGAGMDEATIRELRSLYADSSPHEEPRVGIGLINVLKRLQLYFGAGFIWEIRSNPYVETTVNLQLPVHKEEERSNHESINRR